jgi:hypothetical protein
MPRDFVWANIQYLERLVKRLELRELPVDAQLAYKLLKTIMPVTSIDDLLSEIEIKQGPFTPTGIGWFTALTIPAGERWEIYSYSVARDGAGDATYDMIQIYNAAGTLAVPIASFTAAASNSAVLAYPQPVKEGHLIKVHVAAWSSGNSYLNLLTRVGDAY